MKKIFRYLGIVALLIIISYALGPKVEVPELTTELPELNIKLSELETSIKDREAALSIKPGNESQLIWANDSLKQKTNYALVYLHGFSASPEEGNPAHIEFAKRYGMNLYVPRLFEHGLESKENMLNFTAKGFLGSAKEAIAVGKLLGDSVIVMACSTGGTAALFTASGNPDIHSLILYSPNIDLYNKSSNLITMPWGLQLLQLINGGNIHTWEGHEEAQKYWHTSYRIESIVQMKLLLQTTMKENVFRKVEQPVFMGYYYKNEEEQDNAVSVQRMHEMFVQLGTATEHKRSIAFPDAETHGIQNKYFSKDFEGVVKSSYAFAEEVLGLKPTN